MYYGRPAATPNHALGVALNGSFFNARRMVLQYRENAYQLWGLRHAGIRFAALNFAAQTRRTPCGARYAVPSEVTRLAATLVRGGITMRGRILALWLALTAVIALPCDLSAQGGPVTANPILFVTQVPVGNFTSVTSTFGNHRTSPELVPRGGDLVIRYPDGTLRFLTQEAGFGNATMQGVNAIAVREPCVHWNGDKALFSMIVGAPSAQYQVATFYWQIYEITGLGQGETASIRHINGQPANFNNVSPIYATDGGILFTSDRPPTGARITTHRATSTSRPTSSPESTRSTSRPASSSSSNIPPAAASHCRSTHSAVSSSRSGITCSAISRVTRPRPRRRTRRSPTPVKRQTQPRQPA
jgi:hypothetical protein